MKELIKEIEALKEDNQIKYLELKIELEKVKAMQNIQNELSCISRILLEN